MLATATTSGVRSDEWCWDRRMADGPLLAPCGCPRSAIRCQHGVRPDPFARHPAMAALCAFQPSAGWTAEQL